MLDLQIKNKYYSGHLFYSFWTWTGHITLVLPFPLRINFTSLVEYWYSRRQGPNGPNIRGLAIQNLWAGTGPYRTNVSLDGFLSKFK